jgi:hypothetical protein
MYGHGSVLILHIKAQKYTLLVWAYKDGEFCAEKLLLSFMKK